ncbi:hypothetical protein O6H91_08G024500 [Diphasiastrum complanatum]|uniref:Uncharacterized protein n=1 Tax=Diphasiastrum complanatum TaxID=34168 RepID=A0ACC2CVU3_DIPCM|nr:hypothetical protein O6H91_08G024500 [Diphasiastrum complanatum]
MRCVHCGSPIPAVYIQYSPGNIRLTKCENCKCIADEYVECEVMIILIDLVLHKPEVYRHLFFNYQLVNHIDVQSIMWKTRFFFLLLDTWKWTLPGQGNIDVVSFDSFMTFLSTFGKAFTKVVLSSFQFQLVVLIAARIFCEKQTSTRTRWTDLSLALLVSSYFKLFTLSMLVWDFSPLMVYIVDLLVLSSNIVALKVMLNTMTTIAATTIIAATLSNRLLCYLL